MIQEDFFKLVRERRNISKFKPDPVPDTEIEKMIEIARWAMSGANGQPWEFIVVKDPETRRKMAELASRIRIDQWSIEKSRVNEMRHRAFRIPPDPSKLVSWAKAPVYIVAVGDPRTYQATVACAYLMRGEGSAEGVYLMNMANATQNLHLAAASLGLGAQWISVNGFWQTSLKALLGVPEVFHIHNITIVGYPDAIPKPPFRRELKDIVHYEKYDRSRYRTMENIRDFVLFMRNRGESKG